MAASYWDSTQRKHWTFTKDQLASMRQKLEDEDPALVQSFGLPQLRHLNIFFNQRERDPFFFRSAIQLMINLALMFVGFWYRNQSPWKETGNPTASHGYSPSLYQTLLHKGRNSQDEPISRHHNSPVFSLQDGGVSATYQADDPGGEKSLDR